MAQRMKHLQTFHSTLLWKSKNDVQVAQDASQEVPIAQHCSSIFIFLSQVGYKEGEGKGNLNNLDTTLENKNFMVRLVFAASRN